MTTNRLNELDSALNELGMLATCVNSRHELSGNTASSTSRCPRIESAETFYTELARKIAQANQNKSVVNMIRVNTNYVSNVSVGFRVRPITPHVRYKPYVKPQERIRRRSENNDANECTSLVKAVLEEKIEKTLSDLTQLKKAKSLESIIAENAATTGDDACVSNNFPEIEVVSHCIQNLKVAE